MSISLTKDDKTGLYSIGEKVIKAGNILSKAEVEALEALGKLYSPGWNGSKDAGLIGGDLFVPMYGKRAEILEYIGESSVCVDESVFMSHFAGRDAILLALDDVMVFAPLNKKSEYVERIIRHN